jgi:uncharacterized protein (TIGR02996 family)
MLVMSRLDDLMTDIVANPDDDGPRRVYADALLESGDPYGEFINVQLDLASDGLSRAERIRRRKRENTLLHEHGARWTALADPVFRRGFVHGASVSAEMLTRRSDELLAAAPLLRVVTTDIFEHTRFNALVWIDQVLASPVLPQLEGVQLRVDRELDPIEDEPVQQATAAFAVGAAKFPRLVALAIPSLRQEALRQFIHSDLVRRLSWIDVSAQQPDHAWSILDAIPSGQLRGVRLDWRWMDPLLHESLRTLTIRAGSRPALVRAIGNAIAFEDMHDLDLGITDWEAVQELARAGQLHALRVLRLQGPIAPSQLTTLLEFPVVKRLEVLDLRGVDAATFQRNELESRFDGVLLLGRPKTRARGGCW